MSKHNGMKLANFISFRLLEFCIFNKTLYNSDEAHLKDFHEDAIAHLIWNFMAIYHVLKVFPELNDLPNYEAMAGGK